MAHKRVCYTVVIQGSYQYFAEVKFFSLRYRKEQPYDNNATSRRSCGSAHRRRRVAFWERVDRAGLVVVVETAGTGAHCRLAAGQDFHFTDGPRPARECPQKG
jgi:hypothetical protein